MNSKKYILTVTLNTALDKTLFVSDFSVGKEVRAQSEMISAGGKGINVSRVLQSLGCMTLVTGFLGGSTGSKISQMMGAENIAHHCVNVSGESRISLTLNDVSKQIISRVLESGPVINTAERKQFMQTYEALLVKCKAVVISGSLPLGIPEGFYGKLVQAANRQGLITVLDASNKALAKAMQSKLFLVKPNRQEAQELLGYELKTQKDFRQALKDFYGLGAQNIVISLDKQGAIAFDGDQMVKIKVPQLTEVCSVGSGDAFIGGFLKAYYNNRSFLDAVCYAAAVGAANVLTKQPGHVVKKDINQLLKSIQWTVL